MGGLISGPTRLQSGHPTNRATVPGERLEKPGIKFAISRSSTENIDGREDCNWRDPKVCGQYV